MCRCAQKFVIMLTGKDSVQCDTPSTISLRCLCRCCFRGNSALIFFFCNEFELNNKRNLFP